MSRCLPKPHALRACESSRFARNLNFSVPGNGEKSFDLYFSVTRMYLVQKLHNPTRSLHARSKKKPNHFCSKPLRVNHDERFQCTSVTLHVKIVCFIYQLDGIKTAHSRGMARQGFLCVHFSSDRSLLLHDGQNQLFANELTLK